MSESSWSDSEYADSVHQKLKFVPIYMKGAFSCSSFDDDEDDDIDEDVKRILAEHGAPEPEDCENERGFSSVYYAAVAATDSGREWSLRTSSASARLGTCTTPSENCIIPLSSLVKEPFMDQNGEYADWDQALDDVAMVYPALGVSRIISKVTDVCQPLTTLVTSDGVVTAVVDNDGSDKNPRATAAQDLRKCLEGALYGRDTEDFVVAQPYCVANKNLDFGKPRMSHKATHKSRNKVENWMSKYVDAE